MNQQQKYILNLQRKSRERKREQAFVIEGRKMFEEAPADRIKMIDGIRVFFARVRKVLRF